MYQMFSQKSNSTSVFRKSISPAFALELSGKSCFVGLLLHFAELLLRFEKRRVMCFESSTRIAFAL
jgi:hypothetical protein